MSSALSGEPQAPATNQPPATPPSTPQAPTEPQNNAPDWRASLPDDIKGEESLKVIHDIPSLAKSYLNAQKMIGADKIGVPSKHWSDDDWQMFYNKIGRPELDKYEVALPKDAKFIDPELVKELKPIAHKMGVMPKQLEKIVEWYEAKNGANAKQAEEATLKEIETNLGNLKKEWGVAYEDKLNYAKNVLKEHAPPELIDLINKDPITGNNPHLIKLLNKVGEILYKEGNIPEGGTTSGKHTPEEALRMAHVIMGDSAHPYNNAEHANHKAAVKEVNDLMAMAYPSQEENT